MAKRKRKRRSTSVRRALSAAPKRRRRKRGFLSSGGNTGLMMSAKNNLVGAAGGSLFLATRLIKLPLMARAGLGYLGSMALSMYAKAPFLAAGLAGATTYELAGNLLQPLGFLNDGDLEDVEYVDPNTLSDTGMEDGEGNQIVMDDNGNAYALQSNGELEEVGDAYALQDANTMGGISMYNLADNPYALSSPYGY